MNDYDIDLIVDLIESQLSAPEAEAALVRITADAELSAEYDEQLAVRASLDALPVTAMTASEKEALNTALVSQLHLEQATAVVPLAPRRRAWWMPIAGIAATAAAVTAFVIIPSMSGSDDSSTDITVAAAAAERAPEESTASDNSADDGSAGADATEEVPLVALSKPPITVVELEEADLVDLLDATAGESSPEAVQDRLNSLGFTKEATVPPDVLADCISDISGQLPPETTDIVLYGVDSSGSTLIAHIGLVFGDGIGAAMSVDLDTCSIVIPGN